MSPLTIHGDNVLILPTLPSSFVQTCITSPPYFGLRDYGVEPTNWPEITYVPMAGINPLTVPPMVCCLGQESNPGSYTAHLVHVFREVRRVLRDDGTLWLNLGDSYAGSGKCSNPDGSAHKSKLVGKQGENKGMLYGINKPQKANKIGLRAKDLMGIPWRAAFALQADGWVLRQDIIWSKPNPMPESVNDRCTKSHEYIFMFSKNQHYYYDSEAIKTPPSPSLIKQVNEGYQGSSTKDFDACGVQNASSTKSRIIGQCRKKIDKQRGHSRRHAGFNERWDLMTTNEQRSLGANKKSVWNVATKPYRGAHFATFPSELIEPCVLAGSGVNDWVMDIFGGSGTSAEVALKHGRKSLIIELNPTYVELSKSRHINLQRDLLTCARAI
ncbi:MAG: site-specific DNA-methyltransferase [Pseudomonadota bacterium]|nr:site-specific DNA-methyltransferase [Pseudomonadota bacterium]